MYTPVFRGKIENGKLLIEDKPSFQSWIVSLNNKNVEVTIKQKKKKRTSGKQDEESNANGWYWGIIIPICADELGYTYNEMHETFTALYAPKHVRQVGKTQIAVPIRTSEMDTIQFAQYCDSIIQHMAEMGVMIPLPNQTL